MLRRLTFSNFKTWHEADTEFGHVTGLFGTNSSGKTSLIQFLLMLKQTKEATDRALSLELNGNYVQLGLFSDLVFGHDEKLSIEWSFSFERADDLVIVDPAQRRGKVLIRSKSVRVDGSVIAKGGAPQAQQLKYTVGQWCQGSAKARGISFSKGKRRWIRLKSRRHRLPFRPNPRPSLDASWSGEILCLSRPSQDLLSKRLVSFRSRSGIRKCTRQHLLPWSTARLSEAGLSLGEVETTRCGPQGREGD